MRQPDWSFIGWVCGYVFPIPPPNGGSYSMDDIAGFPVCERRYETRAEREACDHGV